MKIATAAERITEFSMHELSFKESIMIPQRERRVRGATGRCILKQH